VGEVKSLKYERGKIRVTLNIDRDVEIPEDSIFKLGDTGLLGGKRVDIVWGNEDSGFIEPGAEVTGKNFPGTFRGDCQSGGGGG